MRGPKDKRGYPDRKIDCEDALEHEFLGLIQSAEMAGWSRQEAYEAVMSICQNSALGDLHFDALELALEEAKLRRER